MKILHCCLASFYIDNYGYQENVMTRVHKKQGHDVYILASTETIDANKGLTYVQPSNYINEDGIPVYRVPYVSFLPHRISRKLRIYSGVEEIINKVAPDVIFMHDGQTSAVYAIRNYVKSHSNVMLYIDSHTDFVNSAKSWISRNILHRLFYKKYVKDIAPYVRKFYGTLPARVEFYRDFYGTPADKTEYLPMGVDDISIDFSKKTEVRTHIREKFGIDKNDFVIVSGGKLEPGKNIISLITAFKQIDRKDIKLLLFGSVMDNIKADFYSAIDKDDRIIYAGWIQAQKTYEMFFAADLACFPGTHSTLWEESVGYGLPAIFKYWKGITHIDLGGNCMLITEEATDDVIMKFLNKIIGDEQLYKNMKSCAETKGFKEFSYSNISKYAINQ